MIFEVNGLPSIELKYRYPGAEDDWELKRKLEAQERACLDAADMVVTPSHVTRQYLISARCVPSDKVAVIPNGVDTELFRPVGLREREPGAGLKLLYFGTLSAWQGVELAIRALAQVRQVARAEFTVIGAGSNAERDALMALAARLDVASGFTVLPAMPQASVREYLGASDVVLAPLTLNDRNLVQGCCPLKILESMAAGVPVIASDLPVVRELGSDGIHFLLVKAGVGGPDRAGHSADRRRFAPGGEARRASPGACSCELHLGPLRQRTDRRLRRTRDQSAEQRLKLTALLVGAEISNDAVPRGLPHPRARIRVAGKPVQHLRRPSGAAASEER